MAWVDNRYLKQIPLLSSPPPELPKGAHYLQPKFSYKLTLNSLPTSVSHILASIWAPNAHKSDRIQAASIHQFSRFDYLR